MGFHKRAKTLVQEFKTFAVRGNVMDMAVGVIIGSAFSGIVTSLVNDILTPVLSLITQGVDISGLSVALGTGDNAASINYGAFLTKVIDFLIIAVCVFLLVKVINRLQRPKKHEPTPPPRKCPYCLQAIEKEATRCPHCTSLLPAPEESAPL